MYKRQEDGNYIQVRIGNRTIRTLIDTGSGYSIISHDLAKKLGIRLIYKQELNYSLSSHYTHYPLKYRTLAHLSFTNTIHTLRILKPLCQPAPGTAAATRPCSQITLGRLVKFGLHALVTDRRHNHRIAGLTMEL